MINKDFMRFGGGGDTFFTPVALIFLILAGVLILVVPRKHILIPFLFGCFLIPATQTVAIAGLHFIAVRILIVIAWIKIASQWNKVSFGPLRTLDKLVIAWGISVLVTFTLLWGSLAAFIGRSGLVFDAFGAYFLLRFMIQDKADICRTAKILALVTCVVGICMSFEHYTRYNIFWTMGGYHFDVGDPRVRSEGPFAHPILAGTFGATLFPLFVGLWSQEKSRLFSIAGMAGATAMTLAAASSTALIAFVAGIVGLGMFPFRKYMKVVRWGIAAAITGLHIAMKAPVWALVGRVDVVGSSSADHRFQLIDQAINHFWDWWLVGQKTTYQWGYNLWDTSDTYVETAVTGGIATLILLVAIIVYCFKFVGRARKVTKEASSVRLFWGLGSALFATTAGFVGISYFDQTDVLWYILIACSCTAVAASKKSFRELSDRPVERGDVMKVPMELAYEVEAF